jgi:hypothetical protein
MPRASRSRSSKRSSSALGGILSEDVGTDHALLDLATNDVVNQTVRAQHLLFTARGVQRYPVLSRFAYRSELDLMARPSGMPLRQRYRGWDRDLFIAASPVHTSVYERQPIAASASPRITSKRVMTGKPTRKS